VIRFHVDIFPNPNDYLEFAELILEEFSQAEEYSIVVKIPDWCRLQLGAENG